MLRLVIAVVLLHAVAMTIYYGTGIAHGPSRTRNIYLITWSVVTAVVVGVMLRRVRLVRYANRSKAPPKLN